MLTVQHIEQQLAETKRYLKTKGKPNRMHDLIRDHVVAIEFLLAMVEGMTRQITPQGHSHDA